MDRRLSVISQTQSIPFQDNGDHQLKNLVTPALIINLIALCVNIPQLMTWYPWLFYLTMTVDVFCFIILSVDLVHRYKLASRSNQMTEGPRLKKMFFFDVFLTVLILLSALLQGVELVDKFLAAEKRPVGDEISKKYFFKFIRRTIRAPRPGLMIWIWRNCTPLRLPQSSYNLIVKKAGQQIWGVTLFLLFFLVFYGILGVQLFGNFEYHCVRRKSNRGESQEKYFKRLLEGDVSYGDLAIPDRHCSPFARLGEQGSCPPKLTCQKLGLNATQRGCTGFENIITSVKTVYEAASQEGWIYLMYNTTDAYPVWHGYVYFISMIFFLAWLVKNVFIAVVIETFAEIRVQLNNIWGSSRTQIEEKPRQPVLHAVGPDMTTLELVDDDENDDDHPSSLSRFRIFRHLKFRARTLDSKWFKRSMMAMVSCSVMMAGYYDTTEWKEETDRIRVGLECFFVIVFLIEALVKIKFLGWNYYMKFSLHRYELFLVIIGTVGLPLSRLQAWSPYFRCVPVLRTPRLIRVSSRLECFIAKIFGPGKKMVLLLAGSLSIILCMAMVSMQLFATDTCEPLSTELHRNHFCDFPRAAMAMFQILTQEDWVDVMNHTSSGTSQPFVIMYFIFYHFFATTVLLSVFVAVILDNLELEEELKKIKQLKMRQISADKGEKLPWRIQLFNRFPNRPQMVESAAQVGIKLRASVLASFIERENATPLDQMSVHRNKNNKRKVKSTGDPIKDIINNEINRRLLIGRRMEEANQQARQLFRAGSNLKSSELTEPSANISRQAPQHRSTNFQLPASADNLRLLHHRAKEARNRKARILRELEENHPFFDKPLFIIPRHGKFRNFCKNLVDAQYNARDKISVGSGYFSIGGFSLLELIALIPYIDWFMLFMTIVSTLFMLTENHQNRLIDRSNLELRLMEWIFLTCMTLELGIKACAKGLIFTPNAILASAGGVIDLLVWIGSIGTIFLPEHVSSPSFGYKLLCLRCLRPVRIFKLLPPVRKVAKECLSGWKEILMVSVILSVLLFVFAAFGVVLFGDGKLKKCNDFTIHSEANCTGFFFQKILVSNELHLNNDINPRKLMVPRAFVSPRNFNFDTMENSMLTLFEVLSLKGWVEVRDVMINRIEPWWVPLIYIHIFAILGWLIGLTLFIGVVVANYNENKGTALLTVDQRRWEDLSRRLRIVQPLHQPPRPEDEGVRARCYDISQHTTFKRTIAFCVLANSFLLSLKWEGDEAKFLACGHCAISVIFILEVIIKLIGMGFKGMCESFRNLADMCMAVLSIPWMIVYIVTYETPGILPEAGKELAVSDAPYNATAGAISTMDWWRESNYKYGVTLILFRFLFICGKHNTLKNLIMTIAVSVYKSFFIILAMFLLLLCYSLLGVLHFGSVKYGEMVNRHANFQSGPRAVITLFRIVTGEDWNKIMHDCMAEKYCYPSGNRDYWLGNCGSYASSLFFFCSFYVIIAYIMLNLLVAIIVENFSLFYSAEDDTGMLSQNDIRVYQQTWNIIDIKRKGQIRVKYQVRLLLRLLRFRLTVNIQDRLLFKHMCCELEQTCRSEMVSFYEVLMMIAYRSVDIRKSLQLEELIQREQLEATIDEEVAKETIKNWLERCVRRKRVHRKSTGKFEHPNARNIDNVQRPVIVESCSSPSGMDQLSRQESVDGERPKLYRQESLAISGDSVEANWIIKNPFHGRPPPPPIPTDISDWFNNLNFDDI